MPKVRLMTHEEMANKLRQRLSELEFLQLQELLDGDADRKLSEEVSKLAADMRPDLFTSELACDECGSVENHHESDCSMG